MNPHSSPAPLNRRQFIAGTALTGAGLALGAKAFGDEQPRATSPLTRPGKTSYALVGVGSRAGMYREAVHKTYADHTQMVGFCDLNEGRLKLAQAQAQQLGAGAVPIYAAKDFERMIRETKPDIVIVTTKDATHDHYIIRALELGCDVLTEKPMTTDEHKCRAILKAQRASGRRLRVTFNYRYSPPRTQVKELLMSGVIGDVLSVDFHWMLDTSHGADYFRRWHSNKANSGGLIVHKASHHFDLVNWWLSAVPVSVAAAGKREFYTPKMAKRLGLQSHHERCHTCPEKDKCSFFLDLAANENMKQLYLDQEQFDGYFRDKCVWRPDIDIEDTMNLMVRYNTGATMSYSLNAFNGWEGYVIAFNGTKGRLEHKIEEKVYLNGLGKTGSLKPDGTYIRIFPLRAEAQEIKVWEGIGEHAGGDTVMLNDLFLPNPPHDKFLRAADHRSGAYAILTGVAANRSMASGGATIKIADLVPDIGMPDYPAMPSHDDPVPMPPPVV